MKKWLVYIYPSLCIFCIITSVLFCINLLKNKSESKKMEEIKKQDEEEEVEEKYKIDFNANETIRVKLCGSDEIVAMDINDYLRGVVPAEMPPYYDLEAIKAQAVVARTYTYKRVEASAEGENADVCDNYAHCQAYYNKEKIIEIWKRKGYDDETITKYWNNINEAVVSTQDEVIVYGGNLIKAFFHASSPLKTESVDQIWGGESLPYLVSVENNESEEYANRNSTVTVSFGDFISKLKEKNLVQDDVVAESCKDMKICDYTTSGRVKNVEIGKYKVKAESLRSIFSLRSTNFTFDIKDENIVFNVLGNGHGIGLSQVGADYYAKSGMNYKDIIKHYYTGVEIVNLK